MGIIWRRCDSAGFLFFVCCFLFLVFFFLLVCGCALGFGSENPPEAYKENAACSSSPLCATARHCRDPHPRQQYRNLRHDLPRIAHLIFLSFFSTRRKSKRRNSEMGGPNKSHATTMLGQRIQALPVELQREIWRHVIPNRVIDAESTFHRCDMAQKDKSEPAVNPGRGCRPPTISRSRQLSIVFHQSPTSSSFAGTSSSAGILTPGCHSLSSLAQPVYRRRRRRPLGDTDALGPARGPDARHPRRRHDHLV